MPLSNSGLLPFVISNPHCSTTITPSLAAKVALTPQQIEKDGDEQADAIYQPLQNLCQHYVEAEVARALVDLNRKASDFSADGVIKQISCYGENVYSTPLDMVQKEILLSRYYFPYHRKLLEAVLSPNVKCLFDCHTMAAIAPPIARDTGQERPLVCLGNHHGQSCPPELFDHILTVFKAVFDDQVTVNEPFAGGYICQNYGGYLPTIQIELSRTSKVPVADKIAGIRLALSRIWASWPDR